jgi:DNA-binding protein YbaB
MDALPGDLSERLAEYRQLAERIRVLRDGVGRITATATSPDGLISATVGGRGELVDLTLDPRVYRDPDAAGLAAAIAETIRTAAGQAEQEATRLTEELVRGRDGRRVDPMFGPLLHVLDSENERAARLWPR